MTIYRYLPSRGAVVDGVVEIVVDELCGDPDVLLDTHQRWSVYFRRLATRVRHVVLVDPRVFPE